MNADQKQLQSIDVDKFRIITIDNKVWLSLPEEDTQSGGAFYCGTSFDFSKDLRNWLANWNIDRLENMQLSASASFVSRKLIVEEKEIFETLRAKLLRCKQYALNYYENSLFKN